MPKNSGVIQYPVKVAPGDTRYVAAKQTGTAIKILPPKKPTGIVAPNVTTTVPNPRILASVANLSRELVMRTAKAGDPEPYVFGRCYVEPRVIAADDSGDYLVLDLLWSVGPVQRVCNGLVASIASPATWDYKLWLPDHAVVDVSPGTSPLLHEHFLGTAGQSASVIMTNLKGSYDALPNKAHSVISLQQGWNLNILAAMDGVEVADPRTSPHTTAWTENPALILADIFTRCGYTMDWPSVGDAADYCDEIGDATYSPGQVRWAIGGTIYDRNSLQYWSHTLAQYANCYVDVRGGYVYLIPDMPRASNHTVTAADMIEGSARLRYRGNRDAPSKVNVLYKPASAVFSASYGTSDGPGTETTLNMPWWDKMGHAGRKAEETYRKAHNEIESLEYASFDDGLLRTLGDVGTITNSALGLSAKTMQLVANDPVDRGRWRRKYVEYNATNYINAFAGTDEGGASGTINNPFSPPDGPTPTLTAELVTSTSPNYYRIKIDFSPVTWAYLRDYKVNVYIDGVPETILHSEYVAKFSEVGSPQTITVYADLTDSPGFQMSVGNSPKTVYRVDIYNRSLWVDQEGNEVLSTTPGTATVTDPTYTTTAKWFNDGGSPTEYYRTGGGSVIGASPQDWNALIPATGSGDTYQRITLVFCVHPNEYAEAFIFGAAQAHFGVAMNDASGGLWLTARNAATNSIESVTIAGSGSPTNAGGLTKDAWHAVMIAAYPVVGPTGIWVDIWIDGAEAYSGYWNSTGDQFNPMSYAGYVYAGMGDYSGGSAPGHDPDLWEGLNCYVSHVWCNEQYLDPGTYWTSFFDASNKPIDLGADGSTPTGSAPVSFFPDGDFSNNRGTGPNWTEVGTVPDAPTSPTD